MQDAYIGDIGDYGKYGLLRKLEREDFSVAINWYYVIPDETSKQEDGKYTDYLDRPEEFGDCDEELFKHLYKIVKKDAMREVKQIERATILRGPFFRDEIDAQRARWHAKALKKLAETDIVFLDPDNGLQPKGMHEKGILTQKHVSWGELRDYYLRGQTVILYQHRPQMMKREECIENLRHFGKDWLKADNLMALEYPRYTNRYYFVFAHKEHVNRLSAVYREIEKEWMALRVKFIEW